MGAVFLFHNPIINLYNLDLLNIYVKLDILKDLISNQLP